MRKRSWALFGAGLAAGLSSTLGISSRAHKHHQTSVILLYAGTWQYRDEERNRIHVVEISPELQLCIDHKPIKARVESITDHNLVYMDTFGYRITFTANEAMPISMTDEADDQTYVITTVN